MAVSHPLFARFYARVAPGVDAQGFAAYRKKLLAGLSGRVIEIGAGAGANFAHYPPGVRQVTAVEPEPYLRDKARSAPASVPVEIVAAIAEELPAGDGAYDAAVVSLALCSVSDVGRALAELHRVVRAGGQLRFLEHVRGTGGMARAQRALDATVWPFLFGGCHTSRDTVAAVRSAGFRVDHLEQFRHPETRLPLPTALHVIGHATRT